MNSKDCEPKFTHMDEMLDNLCNLHGDPTPALNAVGTVSIHLLLHARVPDPLSMRVNNNSHVVDKMRTDLDEVCDLSTRCDHDFTLRVTKSSKVLIEGIEQTDTSPAVCVKFDGRGVDVSALWTGMALWAGYFDEGGTRLVANSKVVREDITVIQWAKMSDQKVPLVCCLK